MKRLFVFVGLAVMLLASCRLSQINPFKSIEEYPAPEFTFDNTRFAELGCFDSPDCLPANLESIEFPVDWIYPLDNAYGGLDPKLPMAQAGNMGFAEDPAIPSVYIQGCMGTYYVRYLVEVDGEIQLVDSAEGLKDLFAPIESEDEALSYAVAVTGLTPLNDLNSHPFYKRYTRPLVESHSIFDGNLFTVNLYDDYICGCGPHIVTMVTVTVQQDGTFSKSEPINAFSDPKTNGMCID
ncbi:MAG: hypothetical protein CVU42_10730 [Chloroflexi bacterium HGW-Chloroflexi-4]|jgi:hypothetical protein|nr:MAG: hypothetical protein CVU42_10730 [Chloroflexi bacterium HGW-Chloroflexi-4]